MLDEIEEFVRDTVQEASRGRPPPAGGLTLYAALMERLEAIEVKMARGGPLTDDERAFLVLAHEEMPRGSMTTNPVIGPKGRRRRAGRRPDPERPAKVP